MDQSRIGGFIMERRKRRGLTQAQLAERLNITDRAVSKWENGKSMPDSSIMLELCEILEITVNELLNGAEIETENLEKQADETLILLKRRDENTMARNVLLSILYSVTLLVGMMVCLICDLARSGRFTWSLIPVLSIAFAWVISVPSIILGKKGLFVSLISVSIFTIPYLFLLSRILHVKEVFSIGGTLAAASVVFLWVIAAVFKLIGKARAWAALGTVFLLSMVFHFVINALLCKLIAEPMFDLWDLLSVFLLLILAFLSFLRDYAKRTFVKGDVTEKGQCQ